MIRRHICYYDIGIGIINDIGKHCLNLNTDISISRSFYNYNSVMVKIPAIKVSDQSACIVQARYPCIQYMFLSSILSFLTFKLIQPKFYRL